MPDTDVKKALELLKAAHNLLISSEVENLKKSANYLKESIHWLNQQHSGRGENAH